MRLEISCKTGRGRGKKRVDPDADCNNAGGNKGIRRGSGPYEPVFVHVPLNPLIITLIVMICHWSYKV